MAVQRMDLPPHRVKKNYAPHFIQGYLDMLGTYAEGQWLPERVLNLVLQNLTHCISRSSHYKLLKAKLDMLLFKVSAG